MRNREVWALWRMEQNSLANPAAITKRDAQGSADSGARWQLGQPLGLAYFFVALPSITGVHFVPSCDIS